MSARRPIAVVLGTRPEIIKMSLIIRLLQKKKAPYFLIHTGQHYSYNMDAQFFKDLELPKPKWKFVRPTAFGSNKHGQLVRWMSERIAEVLKKEKPHAVLVQGDTDTVLAGAQAASRVGAIVVGHVEAGLRSYDQNMPEERNRIAADKLSHLLFSPTVLAKKNLLKEKFDRKKILVTGNTIVDALFQNLKIAEKKSKIKIKESYALVTLHRPESVDNKERLIAILQALGRIATDGIVERIIFPIHPRTKNRLAEFGVSREALEEKGIFASEPVGFLDFIRLEKKAGLILTDSGGVQEEACILKVPCVTLRTTTERPETVRVGANVVAGYDPDKIVSAAHRMLKRSRAWKNPFGDGRASQKILKAIEKARV